MNKYFHFKIILVLIGFSVLLLSSIFLFSNKHNNNNLNSYLSKNINLNLFNSKKINVNISNEQITNLQYDATPQDNKIYIATNKYILGINSLTDSTITDTNFNNFIVADLSSITWKDKKNYIDQLYFDQNNNMFFDSKVFSHNKFVDRASTISRNLFVKHLNSNSIAELHKIQFPSNVFGIRSYKISKNGNYIAIETFDKKLYVGKISWNNNYSSVNIIWANLISDSSYARIKNYSYDFDNDNDLYLLNSRQIFKYDLINNDFQNNGNIIPTINNNLIDNILFDSTNISLYGMQININKNNNVLLSTTAETNNDNVYSQYFYKTSTEVLDSASGAKNKNSFKILNTNYINVSNESTANPFFNYYSIKYGINNSIALINSFSNAVNPSGLYFSPTGIPIQQITDSQVKDKKGTFSFYSSKNTMNNNSFIATAVNNFNIELNNIAVASNNQVLFGIYNTSKHLVNSSFAVHSYKSFVILRASGDLKNLSICCSLADSSSPLDFSTKLLVILYKYRICFFCSYLDIIKSIIRCYCCINPAIKWLSNLEELIRLVKPPWSSISWSTCSSPWK